MNKMLLRAACIVVVLVFLVNAVANRFYWYSAMWWFDIPMHIMGGMFLGLLAGAVFFKRLVRLSRHDAIVTVMLFVLVFGIGWEFFEYIVQAIIKDGPALANIPDSIKDVLMDIIGGTIASCFVLRTLKRYNKTHANISRSRIS